MSDIDLQLVRECFELHRFQVATRWGLHVPGTSDDHPQQLYVQRHDAQPAAAAPFLLTAPDLFQLGRALLEVRVWHTERLYLSTLESTNIFTQFAEPGRLGPALDFFGTDDFRNVLIISSLPQGMEQRAEVLKRLDSSAVDHVVEFGSILQGLIEGVSGDAVYSGSHTLQTVQLLKRYHLLRRQQMELPFGLDSGVSVAPNWVETAD